MSVFDQIFLPKRRINEFTLSRYIHDMDEGIFRDKMCLGICEANGGSYLLKDFTIEPNALFVGSMGSGKSVAANFSITTWMCANSDQTILFLVDAVKGANDYKALFEYPEHVYQILNSEQKILRVIDLIYDEAMARKEKFTQYKAESITAYEKITKTKVAKIILMMEEFHSIPYTIMNFDRDFKTAQTTANKFHTLMRIGRAYGIWVMAASQKSTKSDIPSEIVPNFTQKQIFRVSRAEAAYILGDTKAADIRTTQKGRCQTEYGSVQFPFMPVDTQVKLLKKYVKKMDAECVYLTHDTIINYLSGKSHEELYKLKKLSDLVKSIENENVDADTVIGMLHKSMGHTIGSVDSKIDPNGVSHIVTMPNDVKLAVVIRVGDKIKPTPKHILRLAQGMKINGCTRGIIYTSANDLPQNVYKLANDSNIKIVDHEDLVRLALQIESGTVNKNNFDPSELTDHNKETGEYQQEQEKIHPHAPPTNVVPIKPILQDLLSHNDIGFATKQQMPKLKRVSVKLNYMPKKDEIYTILVHAQRTQNNEIFRVLLYALGPDNSMKTRYFVDRKLHMLDDVTAAQLEVSSVKDWNNQPQTLTDAQFETKVLDFLNNFKICQMPPGVVTWGENVEWLTGTLKKAPHLLDNPGKFEDYIEASFGQDLTKEKLVETLQVKPDSIDMFFPTEIDRKIWEIIS
jgi:hypothetical protein